MARFATFYEQEPDWLHNRKGKAVTELQKDMKAVARINYEIRSLQIKRDSIITACTHREKMTFSDFENAFRKFQEGKD